MRSLFEWWRAVRLPRPTAVQWDAAFAAGRWDFLADRSERARLALVAHLVGEALPEGGAILDLGCGQGLLARAIAHLPYQSYRGVDLSAVAIARAAATAGPRDRFEAADAQFYAPPAPVDVVVLNEMLYYLPDPEVVVRRMLAALRPGGALVVSIYDKAKTRGLWRMLRACAAVEDGAWLVNAQGVAWRIALLRAPPR